MKVDYSRILYDAYYSRGGGQLEFTLKNGDRVVGEVVSFFHGGDGEYITRWHILPPDKPIYANMANTSFEKTITVATADIDAVRLLPGNFILKFK